MTLLNKEQILSAPDLKTKDVDVPEWGGTVRVTQITAADRCVLQMLSLDEKGRPKAPTEINKMMTIGLCALAIVDENGNRIFSEQDIEALGKKSPAAMDRVFEVADDLNGISAEIAESLKKKSQ